MQWLEHIISTIAPHVCLQCGREGALLCDACAAALPPAPRLCYRCGQAVRAWRLCKPCRNQSPLHGIYVATIYKDTAKHLVHRLKFGRAQAAADTIAHIIIPELKTDTFDLIVYVPTANTRVRQRGYDQAALIAKRLSRLSGLPYAPLLLRTGKERQLGQGGAVRRAQLQYAFTVRKAAGLRTKHALIVDDVLTTGSTLEAAARALLDAGASRVSAAAFAIAPAPKALAKRP